MQHTPTRNKSCVHGGTRPTERSSAPLRASRHLLRPPDVRGRLAHRQLAAAPDLASSAPLQHAPVDAAGRRHVLVSDLVGDVFLAGAGGEQRRDAGVAQRVRGDLLADLGEPGLGPLAIGRFQRRRDYVLSASCATWSSAGSSTVGRQSATFASR